MFRCKACRYELNADLNASINIAVKYLARDGTSVSGGPASDGLLSQAPAVVATRVCLNPTTSMAFVSWPENHTDGADGAGFEFRDKPPSLGGGI